MRSPVARTPDTASKFSRRRWQGRFTRLQPILLALAVLAVAAFAGWVVLSSSWLATEQVTVAGERTLSDQKVLAAADIGIGTPLLRLDLDAVDERVSALRPVAEVTVHRSWPHTVAITVTERVPVAAIYRVGSWWVIDNEGVLFRRTRGRVAGLPLVRVSHRAGPSTLREAATVIAALPPDLVARLRHLTAPSMDSLTLTLKDGREVRWGSAAETDQKVQVLSVLLARQAQVYDVSVPAQPTTAD